MWAILAIARSPAAPWNSACCFRLLSVVIRAGPNFIHDRATENECADKHGCLCLSLPLSGGRCYFGTIIATKHSESRTFVRHILPTCVHSRTIRKYLAHRISYTIVCTHTGVRRETVFVFQDGWPSKFSRYRTIEISNRWWSSRCKIRSRAGLQGIRANIVVQG